MDGGKHRQKSKKVCVSSCQVTLPLLVKLIENDTMKGKHLIVTKSSQGGNIDDQDVSSS